MIVFLLRRFVLFIATLAVASLVVFLVLEVLPGDPAQVILGVDAQPDTLAALRKQLGLDQPKVLRYLAWSGGLLRGDFGVSYTYNVPVGELLAERLTTAIALSLGVYAASHHNRAGDVGVMALSQLGIALPNFWFALLLILFFSIRLGWFSSGGFPGWDGGVAPA